MQSVSILSQSCSFRGAVGSLDPFIAGAQGGGGVRGRVQFDEDLKVRNSSSLEVLLIHLQQVQYRIEAVWPAIESASTFC